MQQLTFICLKLDSLRTGSLTYEILKGFTDALCTLSSHAVGAENYHLAGQYIQLSQIIFLAIGIPFVVLWGIFTYDVMTLLDMSSSVAEMGQQWATIAVLASVANGLNESLFQFSSVIDSDNYTNIIAVMMSAAQTAYIALTLFYDENASLVDVGWVRLNIVLAFIVVNFTLIAWRGWLDLCWDGMVKTNALKVSSFSTHFTNSFISHFADTVNSTVRIVLQ